MPSAAANRLFASLPLPDQKQLLALSQAVDLPINTVLYEVGESVERAYLLTSGFASQVITVGDGGTAEVGIVGCEGLVGSTALLGRAIAPGRCFMQAAGAGHVVSFELMRQVFTSSPELRRRVLEFVQEQMLTGTYLTACNKLHDTEARFARWILMVQDRLETDLLPLTQEFLAQMLGTRRMTVTSAAGALQRSGLIEYKRGQIRILNRAQLEAAACECYRHIKELYDGLYRA